MPSCPPKAFSTPAATCSSSTATCLSSRPRSSALSWSLSGSRRGSRSCAPESARPDGYGRVIADSSGNILDIVEDSEATGQVRSIDLINTGICMIRRNLFGLVKSVTPENKKGEYYLTDICKIAKERGIRVGPTFIRNRARCSASTRAGISWKRMST